MILCLGTTPVYQRSMTFERLKIDAVNRAREVHDYASGKSINVARVAHVLGAEVIATGFLGGTRGRMIREDLDRAGIPHQFIDVPTETRQCITVIDRAAGTATELVEESSPVPDERWDQLAAKLNDVLPRAKCWIFSGTLPPGGKQDFYARWLPLARECGATAIIDARGEPLRLAMSHGNAIFKMNRDELATTLGRDLSSDGALLEAMRKVTPAEGKLIVTLGSDGAVACDAQAWWRVTAPKVKAVSAVGSGDAFAAGLAVGLSQGRSFAESLRLAAACGAANAITPYAGHVESAEVERVENMVVIEEI